MDTNNQGNEMQEEKHSFKIKGVWMPAMVFFDDDLTEADKRIFSIIFLLDGKDGCYATNSYIGKILKYTNRTISTGVTNLINKKYIKRGTTESTQSNRQMRTLKVTPKAHQHRSPFLSQGRSGLPVEVEAGFSQIDIKDKHEIEEQSKDCFTASEERCNERDDNFINQENNLESQLSSAKQKSIKKKSIDPNQSNAATLRNNTPRKTKKSVKPDYICPKTIQPYIDVWSTITGRCYRGKNTNTYKQDCQAIKRMVSGTFFNSKDTPTVDNKYDGEKLTLDEWRETLESFSLMRNNADYFPKNKKNIKTLTIKSFLYNEMSPSTMKSYFISCIETKPKLLSPQLKDINPDYTNYVIQACKRVFDWDLSNGDRATAIKCANKLSKFFVDNKHRISMYDIHYRFTNQQVDELLTMLEKNESPEYPAKQVYLYGNLTYDKLLPEHLDSVGSLIQ